MMECQAVSVPILAMVAPSLMEVSGIIVAVR